MDVVSTMESIIAAVGDLARNKPHSAVVVLTLLACVAGFPLVERLKEDRVRKSNGERRDPRVVLRNTPSVGLYFFTFPLALVALSYAAPDLLSEFRKAAWFLAIILFPLNFLVFSNNRNPPKLFGILGSAIALLAALSIWAVLKNNVDGCSGHFYLSLLCFAMAAWTCCGLGSYGGWAGRPDLGRYRDAKRTFLLAVQVYFVLGFGFSYTAHQCTAKALSWREQEEALLMFRDA